MKAREVEGLDPDGPLVDNMRPVILVRLDEVYRFAGAAQDPENIDESHDMRIAAKRVRYLLELSEPLFGEPIKRAAKAIRGLQDVLGDIHDCDELIEVAQARGLDDLVAHTRARRGELHETFTREWEKLEQSGFRGELEAALYADPPREEN